jgi:putative addiction module CopG family antidote
MNYSLPDDIQQRIDAQIASGALASKDEVLREAIGTLERRQRGLAHLQQMVAEAEDDVVSGRTGLFDRDVTKGEVRSQLTRRGIIE